MENNEIQLDWFDFWDARRKGADNMFRDPYGHDWLGDVYDMDSPMNAAMYEDGPYGY